jgi:hypothetical protein
MSAVRHGMRVGDEERGLQFTYVNAQRQVLLPRENEYVIRYEFIDKPTKLETPYEMTLAVQGLPVRPRSPIYRLMQVDDCTFTSFAEKERFKIHPLYTEGWSKHWNYHNFWNERAFDPDFIKSFKKGVMERWQTQKQAYCLYVNVTTSDANTPEYRRFRYEWAGKDSTDPMPYAPETKMKRQRVRINPDCPSYIDFYIWHLDKTLRYLTNDGEFPIHLYFDNTDSRRTLFKRVYGVVKKINPLNQIFVHMSGDNNMYAWAFCDWLIEGEENSARYRSYRASNPDLPRDYTHIIDVYKVASRYSPFAFGDKFFLYQFWGWNKTHPEQARKARAHLWSLLFVHDGTTWAAGGPAEKQALVDLGWDDQVEFIPYWRENSGIRVQCEAEPVVASGWKRGPKNLLVMIVNDTDTAATGKLSVDFDAFGFTGDTVSADDYGYGGLAYPESFQKEPPKPMEFDSESPLAFEIGRHSYHLVRFHEE